MRKAVSRIPERLRAVVPDAEATVRPTNLVADELAHRIVAGGDDNVVLDLPFDCLIAWLTIIMCSDLSNSFQ